MQELEVIHRLNLNIIMFIIENGGYASIRSSEMRAFGRTAEGRSFPDIGAIADAFDIDSWPYLSGITNGDLQVWRGPRIIVVHAPDEEVIAPRVLFDGKGNLSNMFPYPEGK
jgi:hypothetical protein